MSARVMVVDDDPDVRALLSDILAKTNYTVTEAADGASLEEAYEGPQPDVILLDIKLPDADGLDLLPKIKSKWPDTEVIVLTGMATFDVAVEATKRGGYDFVPKPFKAGELLNRVAKALEYAGLQKRVVERIGPRSYVFESAKMKEVVRTTKKVAESDVSVLITGESGTGKEVIADLLHASNRKRCTGPFIKINCAALPRELIESELFGSVKGAYTGAQADRQGLFRQAEGGTLLLDELSEMPVDTQSKLLRVLQEKEVRPVGGLTSYKSDCRVIAATNRKVEDAIREGKLREDLYYRISAISIHLPALRERPDDILPLANSFLKPFADQAGRVVRGFSPEAADRLKRYHWPGNVRQLQNEVFRAVLMCKGQVIEAHDLSIMPASASEGGQDNLSLMEAMERDAIKRILEETKGNKVETAKRLGIGRQTLYNKIKAYGIQTS